MMASTKLQIKEVRFNGDTLLATQDNEGNVYAGVSYICNGIGLSKSQKDTQIQNVQSDLVLKRGCLKFQAGVFDPNNATVALLIDFLPLWLAKISITPKMQENNPELVEKLIAYQLKAKDVLAAAFLPQHQPTQLATPYPLLDQSVYHLQQSQKYSTEKLWEHEYRIAELETYRKEIKALKSQASRVERKLKNHIDNKPVITYFGDLQALYDDMSENYQSFVNCHTIQDAENNIVVECQSIFRVVELDKGRLIFRVTKYKPMKMCVLNVVKAERVDNWDGNQYVSKYRLFVRDGAEPIEFEAVIKR